MHPVGEQVASEEHVKHSEDRETEVGVHLGLHKLLPPELQLEDVLAPEAEVLGERVVHCVVELP